MSWSSQSLRPRLRSASPGGAQPERVAHQIGTMRHAPTWAPDADDGSYGRCPDDELDRSGNTEPLPHRRLRPLDEGLPTGTAMSSTNRP